MWTYNQREFTKDDADDRIANGYIGFVYIITDASNGKKYIGKKLLSAKKELPALKGQKKKRVSIVQSNWEKYYGSSEIIKEAVKIRKDDFAREILVFCKSKGELSYMEAKMQFDNEVLLRDDFYNSFVGCKIHANHVKNLWKI